MEDAYRGTSRGCRIKYLKGPANFEEKTRLLSLVSERGISAVTAGCRRTGGRADGSGLPVADGVESKLASAHEPGSGRRKYTFYTSYSLLVRGPSHGTRLGDQVAHDRGETSEVRASRSSRE